MSIFKAYDIRGLYPKELDEKLAYNIGRAFAQMMREENPGKEKLEIVVGHDMRLSADSLTSEVKRGLLEGGVDIINIGLVSTPTFYFAVANFDYDAGLIVSASHNPKDYNGFKLVRKRAVPVSGETGMKDMERLTVAGNFPESDQKGKERDHPNILAEQVKHDLQYGNPQAIKPFKIVADAANAMGALYLEALFEHLSCELIKMNFELDGSFPSHEADPFKEENNKSLHYKVVETRADLGIATDGDGDRIFFVDNEGNTVEPGIVRAILSKLFLEDKPGSKIAYDIRPGKITEETIVAHGGIPLVTRVGHSLIKEMSIREGAYFAGESSGHFFLDVKHGIYEVPMIVTLRILEDLTKSGKSFADYLKPYQKYVHSGEINSTVKNQDAMLKTLEEKYSDGEIVKLDGLSVTYPDFWFNVRPSNTEPLLRLNLEAVDKKTMQTKRDEVLAIIRR